MGSPSTEQDRDSNEGPQTHVTISKGFWMSKYEVTQQEYQAVMGTNPSKNTGDERRPVENVAWTDASNYCDELTAHERAAGRLPERHAYRLPTEAEWEYCCRAGTTTRFGYGDDSSFTQLGEYACYDSNSSNAAAPVGGKEPNAWGLYDMHGNVWEWCWDWYGTYPGGNVLDPRGPTTGSHRVIRGGSWYVFGCDCRSAYWDRFSPDYTLAGFRPVLASGKASAFRKSITPKVPF